MVESQPSKLLVAGSIPVSRSSLRRAGLRLRRSSPRLREAVALSSRSERRRDHAAGASRSASSSADLSAVARVAKQRAQADVAQLAERVLGKDEVTSSILVIGSSLRCGGASSDGAELRRGKPERERRRAQRLADGEAVARSERDAARAALEPP